MTVTDKLETNQPQACFFILFYVFFLLHLVLHNPKSSVKTFFNSIEYRWRILIFMSLRQERLSRVSSFIAATPEL